MLGAQAFRLAGRQPWVISPAVLLELEILREIERVSVSPDRVLSAARQIGDLTVSTTPFEDVVEAASQLSWTRDPIDRLVTAHAIADGAKLLTADKAIRTHFKDAVWE